MLRKVIISYQRQFSTRKLSTIGFIGLGHMVRNFIFKKFLTFSYFFRVQKWF